MSHAKRRSSDNQAGTTDAKITRRKGAQESAGSSKNEFGFDVLMWRLIPVKPGRRFTRDEMNER